MAATPTPTCDPRFLQAQLPCVMSYNAETMTYTAEFTFNVTASNMLELMVDRGSGNWTQATWETVQDSCSYPATVTFTHDGRWQHGGTFTQDVICYPAIKRIENTTGDAADKRTLTVLYEGRLTGIHSVTARTQMISAPLYQDLEAATTPTVYDGIGIDWEGVPREIPVLIYSVTQVVNMNALAGNITIANWVAGSVNEQDWQSPWYVPGGDLCYLGQYLFLGITSSILDKRTHTVALVYEFAHMNDRYQQHIYKWFKYTISPTLDSTGRGKRIYDKCPQTPKIYMVAGTDKWWDRNQCTTPTDPGEDIPEFSDMFPYYDAEDLYKPYPIF